MRAILIGNQLYPEISRQNRGSETGLPPLLDRPFLQHVIESIIEAGANEIDLILPGTSTLVHEALGHGARWGVVLRYHQIPGDASPYAYVSEVAMPDNESSVLLAHADVLPQLRHDTWVEQVAPRFFCWLDGEARWTGWAILRSEDLLWLRVAFNAQDIFDRYCIRSGSTACFPHPAIEEVPRPLLVRTYSDLIEAHARVLQNQHTGLLLTGREIAPGIRISRNVTIHRTTRLAQPVFVGPNCHISEHCHIGPGAFIGSDCIIENRTVVENSVVCAGTYVGEGLDLRQVYIDRGRLVNARLLTEIDDIDELMLGSVYRPAAKSSKKIVSWIR